MHFSRTLGKGARARRGCRGALEISWLQLRLRLTRAAAVRSEEKDERNEKGPADRVDDFKGERGGTRPEWGICAAYVSVYSTRPRKLSVFIFGGRGDRVTRARHTCRGVSRDENRPNPVEHDRYKSARPHVPH